MDRLAHEVWLGFLWRMMFADDMVICSESREQVKKSLKRCVTSCFEELYMLNTTVAQTRHTVIHLLKVAGNWTSDHDF